MRKALHRVRAPGGQRPELSLHAPLCGGHTAGAQGMQASLQRARREWQMVGSREDPSGNGEGQGL